jgi:glycosyltransferase involved in cell wall biosynthesis
MKVSIVIVNYNLGRFLGQAIESALAQTYPDTEIIVIDDGSTDNSADVIASFGDLIVSVFKENGGQASCYSTGLSLAKGHLILYLDSDDFLYPHCLEEAVGNWKEGCVKIHFYLDIVDEHGIRMNALTPSGRLGQGRRPLKMMRFFGAYCTPPASGNIFSRDFLRKIFTIENATEFQRLDKTTHFGADVVPIFSAPYFGTIGAIPRALGCYRRHAGASGGVTSIYRAEDSLKILEREHAKDLIRDHAWRRAAGEMQRLRLPEPSRLKRHICYLRLAGCGLDPADRLLNLSVKGVLSSVLWSGYSWKQKIAISGWFAAMGILPSKVAKTLIRPALGITDRTTRLRKFLQASKN